MPIAIIMIEMRIDGPRKSDETTKPSKKEGAGKTGNASFSNMVGGASTSSGTSGTSATAAVGGAFMLQAVSDEERQKRKIAIHNRKQALSALDELAMALMNNNVSLDHLKRLRAQVATESPGVNDEALTDVLTQIDIRLAVEVAKLERAQEQK